MIKFKEFLTEIYIDKSIKRKAGLNIATGKWTDEDIQDVYKPVSSSHFNASNGEKYHVTLANRTKGDSFSKHTAFIHNEDKNGKVSHVGTIHMKKHGQHYITSQTGLAPAHQGHRVITTAYKHLIKHHGLKLQSSTHQSVGGNKIWQELEKDPELNVQTHTANGKPIGGVKYGSFYRAKKNDS